MSEWIFLVEGYQGGMKVVRVFPLHNRPVLDRKALDSSVMIKGRDSPQWNFAQACEAEMYPFE